MYTLEIEDWHYAQKMLWVANGESLKWWATVYNTGTRSFPKEDVHLILELMYNEYKLTNSYIVKEICIRAIKELYIDHDYVPGYEHTKFTIPR